jgi:hypothetical protein
MSRHLKLAVSLLLFVLISVPEGDCAVISAASCSWEQVQAAVESANEGDTINVPGGSCTWTAPLKIKKPVHLKGAGHVGATISEIRSNLQTAIECIVDSCAQPVEISGFLFVNRYQSSTTLTGFLALYGKCGRYKVHDNRFIQEEGGRNSFIKIGGGAYGVIYKNIVDASSTATGVDYREFLTGGHGGWNDDPVGLGDWSWSDPVDYYGSEPSRFWYVEGNTFFSDRLTMFSDVSWGARVVYRYNSITNGALVSHGFDSNNGGRGRGVRVLIGYNNYIHLTDGSNYPTCWRWRTGTGILYRNDFGSGWKNGGACIHAETFRYRPSMTTTVGLAAISGVCAPYSNQILLCAGTDVSCTSVGETKWPCSSEHPCTSYVGQCSSGYVGCNHLGEQDVCNTGAICANYTGQHYLCNKDSVKKCCYPSDALGACSDGKRCSPIGSTTGCEDGSICIFPNPSCVPAETCVGGASECVGPVDNSGGSGEGPPCRDGVGAGLDSGLGTPQAVEPIFAFANSGTSATLVVSGDGILNSNYFTDYSGGVAIGPDALKPQSCKPGHGYFANDAGILYRCNKEGSGWNTYCVEYPCPHPLTGVKAACNRDLMGVEGYAAMPPVGPSIPSGLRIVE